MSRELAEIHVAQHTLAPLRPSTTPTIRDDLMLGITLIGMTSVCAFTPQRCDDAYISTYRAGTILLLSVCAIFMVLAKFSVFG
jgi:hypothetical protein